MIRDVETPSKATDFGYGLAGKVSVRVADRHLRSRRSERLRHRHTNTTCAAGDRDDPAGEILVPHRIAVPDPETASRRNVPAVVKLANPPSRRPGQSQ